MRCRTVLVLRGLLFLLISAGLSASLAPSSIGAWVQAGSLSVARTGAAAVLLSDGRVLVTGGLNANGLTLSTTEFLSPNGVIAPGPALNLARTGHSATLLASGIVLVAGGSTSAGATNTAELFDPSTNLWTLLPGTLNDARSGHAALTLPNGTIAILGGSYAGTPVTAVEFFDPPTQEFWYLGALSTPRSGAAYAVLADGRMLVAGGSNASGATLATTEIFDPVLGGSVAGPSLNVPRSGASANTMLDGRVAVIGGSYPEGAQNGTAELGSIELIDATQGTATVAPATLVTARTGHIAVLLPDNNAILVAGGTNAGNTLLSTELFLPWNNSVNDSSTAAPHLNPAVAAGSGTVTLAGGSNLAAVEQYGYATLKSDLPDYHPGQLVTLTGSNWQPGETVTLTMIQTPVVDGDTTYSPTADANGNIVVADYAPLMADVGTVYTVTAAGSKSQAQVRFADAGTPVQLGINNPDKTMVTGKCAVDALAIQSQDSSGNASNVSTTTLVSLQTSTSTGAFYAVAGCTGSPITSVTINAGTHSATNAYYQDMAVGTPTITVSELSGQSPALVSAQQTETVNQGGTTTVLTANPSSSSYGTPVTFTATVTPNSPSTGTPTGTVNLKLGKVSYGTITLSGGTGNVVISNLSLPGGSFTAAYSGDTNYKVSTSTAFAVSVNQATPVVTWNNPAAISYGTSLTGVLNATATVTNPAGTISSSNHGSPITAATVLPAGSYTLIATFTTTDPDYVATATASVLLTVNKTAASVTPVAASKVYGSTDPTLSGTLSGFLGADGVTATYNRTPGETVAGAYTITATLSPTGVLGNYNITYNTASFTITQRAASVTPNPATTTYGSADPSLSGTMTGFLPADNVTAVYTRTPGVYVNNGPYVVQATLSPATVLPNYAITYNTAAFTMLQAPLTVTVAPGSYSRAVGAANPGFTGTVVGVVNNDLAQNRLVVTYSSTAVAGSPIGSYPVTATLSGAAAASYNLTVVPGTLSVWAQGVDLIESVVSGPAAGASGAVVQVTDTVKNQGILNAGGSTTGFYISADGVTKGTYLGYRYVGTLSVGASAGPVTTTLTLPVNLNGTYYVMACANYNGGIAESNTVNNCTPTAAFAVTGADLVENGVSLLTTAPQSGGSVQVSDTVLNQGGGTAATSTTGFYLSTNGVTKGTYLGYRYVGGLGPNVTSTAATALTLPANLLGTYYVIACANYNGGMVESNTANDCTPTAAFAVAGADLVESSVSLLTTAPQSGGSVQVSDTVLNQGGGNAAASTTGFYLSTNGTTKTTYLGYRYVGGLGANATSAATTTLTLPANLAGTYYVIACANYNNGIVESNTANNCTASPNTMLVP